MTSAIKATANASNGRKSRGPRTRAGKIRSSRNARRHGLAAFSIKHVAMEKRVKRLVDAICGGDNSPAVREAAMPVAESRLWLSAIQRAKLAVLERLRNPEANALSRRKGRPPWAEIKRKVAERWRAFDIASDQLDELRSLMAATKRAGRDIEREPLPPHLVNAWPPPFLRARNKRRNRYAHQILREGITDLERLLRYEQRAWSRCKKAVYAYMAVKLAQRHGMPAPCRSNC